MLADAQLSMRRNYLSGGPGVVVSGVVWLIGAASVWRAGFETGMWTFFAGGALIHPVSVVICTLLRGKTPPPDPKLVQLALLALPILFAGVVGAFVMSHRSPDFLFPIMACAIGVRYLTFQHIYGLKTFLLLGALLIAVGAGANSISPPLLAVPVAVGVIECMCGLWLWARHTP